METPQAPTLKDDLLKLYNEQKHHDIVLKVGEKQYPAHRLILSTRSDVFDNLLLNKNWNEASQNEIVLEETPICERYFEDFLLYIYTENIDLTVENVIPTMFLSDKYNVQSLYTRTESYIANVRLPTLLDSGLLLLWLEYLAGTTKTSLFRPIWNFSVNNFNKISNGDGYKYISSQLLVRLISSSRLFVSNEDQVLKFVENWFKHNSNSSLDVNVDLVNSIRCQFLSEKGLWKLFRSELFQTYSAVFISKLNAAANLRKTWSTNAPNGLDLRNYFSEGLCFTLRLNVMGLKRSLKWGCQSYPSLIFLPQHTWTMHFKIDDPYNLKIRLQPNTAIGIANWEARVVFCKHEKMSTYVEEVKYFHLNNQSLLLTNVLDGMDENYYLSNSIVIAIILKPLGQMANMI